MEWAKRECILSEAAAAFDRFGFKKASIDWIAKAAGVAKGTIYNAAKSKEDLFYQVLHREVRAWAADVAKGVDPRVPADDLLEQIHIASVEYLEQRPLVKHLLFREAHLVMPGWIDQLDELCAIGRHAVERILELGIKQGTFRSELDVPEVAGLLQDLSLSYYVLHDHGPRDADRTKRIARRRTVALDMILNGIRPERTLTA